MCQRTRLPLPLMYVPITTGFCGRPIIKDRTPEKRATFRSDKEGETSSRAEEDQDPHYMANILNVTDAQPKREDFPKEITPCALAQPLPTPLHIHIQAKTQRTTETKTCCNKTCTTNQLLVLPTIHAEQKQKTPQSLLDRQPSSQQP